MENTKKLCRLGQTLYFKHLKSFANVNAEELKNSITATIETALRNASTIYNLGILPFEKMAKADGLTLSFDVTRDDHLGTRTITVDNISILQPEKAYLQPKYQPLKEQLEAYLKRNWEIYPTTEPGGERIDYQNFTVNLVYNPQPQLNQV